MTTAPRSPLKKCAHRATVVIGAMGFTLAFFLVLPLIQAIGERARPDTLLGELNIAMEQEPPDVVEEEPEPEPEPEPEEPPPEEAPVADLASLEIALNADFLGGGSGAFLGSLADQLGSGGFGDDLLGGGSVSTPARVRLPQARPERPSGTEGRSGTVTVIFLIDAKGVVNNAKVSATDDRVFNNAALDAVRRWRFDPAKAADGTSISSHKQVKIKFPKGGS